MAFNLKTFRTRALTATVFAVIMLAGLLVNQWTFFLLFTIIHFGCWFEYQKLVGLIDADYKQINPFHKYGVMLLGWGYMLWQTNNAYMINSFRLHEMGWFLLMTMIVALPVAEIVFSKQFNARSIGHSVMGLVYISFSLGCMIDLRSFGMSVLTPGGRVDLGWVVPMVLVASIWINDTMAYIVGSLIGKTPLSPISPKKTWEGTIGGGVLAIATVTLVGYYAFHMQDVVSLLVISAIAAIIGTTGDLFESKLKRLAGVKDSGKIMPGHGGFLDRFDSLLLATPFVWLYIQLFV